MPISKAAFGWGKLLAPDEGVSLALVRSRH